MAAKIVNLKTTQLIFNEIPKEVEAKYTEFKNYSVNIQQ